MNVYKVKVGEKEYIVKILGEKENALEIEVDGSKLIVSIEGIEKTISTQQVATQTEVKKEEVKPKPQPTPQPVTTVLPLQQPQATAGAITSRVPGKIKEIRVTEGQSVKQGDTVIVMESMKMEIEVKANRDGVVKTVYVKPGQFVAPGTPLILVE